MKKRLAMLLMAILVCLPILALAGGVQLHQQPINLKQSDKVQVFIEGVELTVTDAQVTHQRRWESRPRSSSTPVALFSMDGSVSVTLLYPDEVNSAIVRPLSENISAIVKGNRVSFVLDRAGAYTVEINGDYTTALHLFASPLETDIPDVNDPSVLYFGPGVHNAGVINLESGQTLYLAGGAVLRGAVHAANAKDIAIVGRGMIDGSQYKRWVDTVVPLDFVDCENVRIEGVTLLNASAWNLNTYRCENVTIDWVNIVAACSNSDGITTQSCRNLKASNCFVRGWDDNLVVKGYDGDVSGILFENCILWTDLAQSMEVGYECRADVMEDITFRNITVLHNFHKPVMSIHNSDNALIKDVRFENIVVEDAQMGLGDGTPILIELTTTKSQWSKAKERGNIRNVSFENIKVLSGVETSWRIFAFSKENTIDDVTFKNIEILGKRITSLDDIKLNKNNKIGSNITFIDEATTVSQNRRGAIRATKPAVTTVEASVVFTATATSYTQSYDGSNLVDGKLTSYWEGANASDMVTLKSDTAFAMQELVIALNPDKVWGKREQTLSVEAVMADGSVELALVETVITFDPNTENKAVLPIALSNVVELRITFANNTGSKGGQAAEIYVR